MTPLLQRPEPPTLVSPQSVCPRVHVISTPLSGAPLALPCPHYWAACSPTATAATCSLSAMALSSSLPRNSQPSCVKTSSRLSCWSTTRATPLSVISSVRKKSTTTLLIGNTPSFRKSLSRIPPRCPTRRVPKAPSKTHCARFRLLMPELCSKSTLTLWMHLLG